MGNPQLNLIDWKKVKRASPKWLVTLNIEDRVALLKAVYDLWAAVPDEAIDAPHKKNAETFRDSISVVVEGLPKESARPTDEQIKRADEQFIVNCLSLFDDWQFTLDPPGKHEDFELPELQLSEAQALAVATAGHAVFVAIPLGTIPDYMRVWEAKDIKEIEAEVLLRKKAGHKKNSKQFIAPYSTLRDALGAFFYSYLPALTGTLYVMR